MNFLYYFLKQLPRPYYKKSLPRRDATAPMDISAIYYNINSLKQTNSLKNRAGKWCLSGIDEKDIGQYIWVCEQWRNQQWDYGDQSPPPSTKKRLKYL